MLCIIFVNLLPKRKEVDQPTDAEQASGKDVENSHPGFPKIKLVDTNCSQKDQQEIRSSFAFHNNED